MRPLNYTAFKTDYVPIAKSLVLSTINTTDFKVFVYGSRATKTNHRFSDLDIGIIGSKPLPSILLNELEEKLNSSRIPFKVEVIDFFRVDNAFKNEAMKVVEWW